VLNAVKLMYAGAALSLIGLIVGLVSIGSLKSAIQQAAKNSNKVLTSTQLHAAEVTGLVFVILVGLVGIGLWVWMARANGAGKSWARVVASVLFGLNTISVLSSVARPAAVGTKIFGLLVWVVGLGAIVLLWRRESTEYINAQSPRPLR